MADTWYLEVMPMQEPNGEPGRDDSGRAVCVFNVMADKKPSATFCEELLQILTDAGVGVISTNLFASAKAVIPAEGGPYLDISETGGPMGGRTQNVRGIAYPKPTAMVFVRAPEYEEARAMARAAFEAFSNIRNEFVTIP